MSCYNSSHFFMLSSRERKYVIPQYTWENLGEAMVYEQVNYYSKEEQIKKIQINLENTHFFLRTVN